MDAKEFEKLVEQGIKALPVWVTDKIENIAFIIEDEPTKRQRKEHGLHMHETLFGLYEGVPLTERGADTPVLPDRITIFRKPILEAYTKRADIIRSVQNTIWHEVAHYFGHDEDWIQSEERKRGKLL